ncbi:MAG: S8 family serine peptidase [Trueperaceae bacterium]|nr:S8 family serine peptidase [Trueperaceae bacterium]
MLLFIMLFFAACLPQAEPSFLLNVTTAQIGDTVTASVENMDTASAKVTVAQVIAEIKSISSDSISFIIPELSDDKLGEQDVVISSGDKIAKAKLTVTAKPVVSSFSLSPLSAASGGVVEATLNNLDGLSAKVTVGEKTASILESQKDLLKFIVPDFSSSELGAKVVTISSGEQTASGELTIIESSFGLNKARAQRGETVIGTVAGVGIEGGSLKLANISTEIKILSSTSFSFVIPEAAPADLQIVEFTPQNLGPLSQTIGILGDVLPGKLTVLVKPQTSESQFREQLGSLGFGLESSLKPLGASSGPCSAELANIDVGDTPLGEALEQLQALEQNGEGIALHVDPRSGWSVGTIDHLGSIGAPLAFGRGHSGATTLIAVLDSGVNPHPELGSRFRQDLSFDFIDNDPTPEDTFDDPSSPGLPTEGHGTPIAILAAGSSLGVAPKAEVMAVKTCDDKGLCLSSNVILGICHALTRAPDMSRLVINLSLGGDTPVEALEAILNYALDNNVLIAAAAGNEGELGSPTHYPAAFPLAGLVAVGALQTTDIACIDFEDQKDNSPLGYGSSFSSQGTPLSVVPYYLVEGQPAARGQVAFTDINEDSLIEAQLSNANLQFSFTRTIGGLEVSIISVDGGINLGINQKAGDTPQYIGALAGLTGQEIAGVKASYDSTTAALTLEGKLETLLLGGAYLVTEGTCPSIGAEAAWTPAPFSTRGAYVDLATPGAGLYSGTAAGSFFSGFEGTSFSTPLVSGALALYREANPTAKPADIEKMLKGSASPLAFTLEEVGAGMLNLSVNP